MKVLLCMTAHKPSSSANKVALMSCVASLQAEQFGWRQQLWLLCVHWEADGQTERQTDTICIHRCLLFSGALIRFLSDRFTSLHAVQLASVCDCRASLSHHCTPRTSQQRDGWKEEVEEEEAERERAGWNIFQGSRHLLSDQPGAVELQIKSVSERKQQNTDVSCAFQPPPGKAPSSGRAGNCSWPTYSLLYCYFTVGSARGIHKKFWHDFSTHCPSWLRAGLI